MRDDGLVHEGPDGRVDLALLVGEAVEGLEVVEHGSPCFSSESAAAARRAAFIARLCA